jgi:L-cysteine:1D-myo-inositol 2-amino-2-deoxy-alpha-D-glucopyranoside ligase
MSKSLGNLVKVSELRAEGVDPQVVRLALLAHHYRSDWEWTDADLASASQRLSAWRQSFGAATDAAHALSALGVLAEMREALADDLDAPTALAVVDNALAHGVDDTALVSNAVQALLGIRLAG